MFPYGMFPFDSFPWFADLQRPGMNGWAPRSYTMRLNEIVQQEFPTLNTMNKAEMLDALKETVFKNMDISGIKPEYQDAFVLGFGLEFWLNEIGQETIDSFRLAVWNVIVKSAGRINALYKLSEERDLFRTYSKRVTSGSQDVTGNRKGTRGFTDNTISDDKMVNDGTTSNSGGQKNKATRSGTQDSTNNSSGSSSSTSDGNDSRTSNTQDLFQDTPQNGLEGVETLEYLTSARILKGTESGTDHNTTQGTDSTESTNNTTMSDTTNSEITSNTSGTSKNTMTRNGTGSVTHDENTNEDTTGSTTTQATDEYFEVDYETVMMGSPILDGVWALFDECFMEVF